MFSHIHTQEHTSTHTHTLIRLTFLELECLLEAWSGQRTAQEKERQLDRETEQRETETVTEKETEINRDKQR